MRNRTTVILGLLVSLCMMTGNVHGQETPLGHLKKDNPNELIVLFNQHHDCVGSYEQVVNNVLAQSRIKRQEEPSGHDKVMLYVAVLCLPIKNRNGIVFNIEVNYVSKVPVIDPQPEEMSWTMITHSPKYGNFGFTTHDEFEAEQIITNSIRQFVENALTDYLKVNFDL